MSSGHGGFSSSVQKKIEREVDTMASYHFEAKVHSQTDKITASYKINYISRTGKYKNISRGKAFENKEKQDVNFIKEKPALLTKNQTESKLEYINRDGHFKDTKKSEDLQYKESGNLPLWAENDPNKFWDAAEVFERSNGTVFRLLEFALPNELTLEQQKEMIAAFIQEVLPNNAYSYAIHKNKATLDPDFDQPHVHLMFSERLNDGINRTMDRYFMRYNSKHPEKGGAKKDRAWAGTDQQRRKHLKEVRATFATIQNKYLEKYNHAARVDHRTLKEQKDEALAVGDMAKAIELDRRPETKLGPKVSRIMIENLQKMREERRQKMPDVPYDEKAQEQDAAKLTSKIAYNFTVRRLRWLTKQIREEYERINQDKNLSLGFSETFIEIDDNDNIELFAIKNDEKTEEFNVEIEETEQERIDAFVEISDGDNIELTATESEKETGGLDAEIKKTDQDKTDASAETGDDIEAMRKAVAEINEKIAALNKEIDLIEEKKKTVANKVITAIGAERIAERRHLGKEKAANQSLTNELEARIARTKSDILAKNKPVRDEFYALVCEQDKFIAEAKQQQTLKKTLQEQIRKLEFNDLRLIRWLSKQIRDEYERMGQGKRNISAETGDIELLQLPTVEAMREAIAEIDEKIAGFSKEINLIGEYKKDIAHEVFTEIGAERMAEYKHLGKEYLKKEKENFRELNKELAEALYEAKKEYKALIEDKQEKNAINEIKEKIGALQAELDRRYKEHLEEFVFAGNPEAKAKIEKTKNYILDQNKSVRDRFYALVCEQDKLMAEAKQQRTLKNAIREQVRKLEFNDMRLLRWLSKQIREEYEKTDQDKIDISTETGDIELPLMPTVEAMQEALAKIDEKIAGLSKEIDLIDEKKKTIAYKVITEIGAERIAEHKHLGKEKAAIEKLKNELAIILIEPKRQYKELTEKHIKYGKPSVLNFQQRAEYIREEGVIRELKNKIDRQQAEFDVHYQEYFTFAHSFETKAKIAQTKNDILAQNKPVRDEFYALVREQNKLTAIIKHHRTLKNEIWRQIRELNANNRANTAQLQKAINNFKRLCRAEEAKQGFGAARLHTDEDERGRVR
jgi:uncharacterized small protein (DUF1192 family)